MTEPPMPMPPINPRSAFASMRGHHAGVRVPDFEESKGWFVDKLDFRVVQEWDHGGLRLAYVAPPADDGFLVEILGGGSPTSQPDYADPRPHPYQAGPHPEIGRAAGRRRG